MSTLCVVSPGGGLARYMQCMDKLRHAVQYLTVNNPDSSQLSHVVCHQLFSHLISSIKFWHEIPKKYIKLTIYFCFCISLLYAVDLVDDEGVFRVLCR